MESTRKPKRNSGVKLSTDPQSVAARQRRHRISDRFRVLKSLVPGGSKMDTVSMLEEAINYVKFLKSQIWLHQTANAAMMVPDPQDQQTLNYNTSYYDPYVATNINNDGSSSGVYNLSNNNGINGIANEQEEVSYELPPPPPSELLAPFPYCSFQQEDEMLLISDNYNSINLDYYN